VAEWSSVYKPDSANAAAVGSVGDVIAQELRGIGIHMSKFVDAVPANKDESALSRLLKKRPVDETSASSPDPKRVLVSIGDRNLKSPSGEAPAVIGDSELSPVTQSRQDLSVHGQLIRSSNKLSSLDSSANEEMNPSGDLCPDDFVTPSQLDFLVNMPPELMSQAMTSIRELNEKRSNGSDLTNTNKISDIRSSNRTGKSKSNTTDVRHSSRNSSSKIRSSTSINTSSSLVAPNDLLDVQSADAPNVSEASSVRLTHSQCGVSRPNRRWRREAMRRIAQAVQIFATLGPIIHSKIVSSEYRQSNHADTEATLVSERERDAMAAFPTDSHIRLLCLYASDLVATKQSDRAVVFVRLLERTFAGLSDRFQVALARAKVAVQNSAKMHLRGQELAL
jgi:hypothetical protein